MVSIFVIKLESGEAQIESVQVVQRRSFGSGTGFPAMEVVSSAHRRPSVLILRLPQQFDANASEILHITLVVVKFGNLLGQLLVQRYSVLSVQSFIVVSGDFNVMLPELALVRRHHWRHFFDLQIKREI